jgi:GTP diphosphokinase / guanosine-3',5'-bis(diphosphate) 3'-diphosphatase
MLTAKQLTKKIYEYLPEADTALVEKAYVFARKAHEGQFRYSGEPYFIHCVAVARHLIEMQLDVSTIAAGLLHDVTEDTEIPLSEIEKEFGAEVAFLVDGVTKLSKVRMSQQQIEQQKQTNQSDKAALDRDKMAVENLRKMFLAMAQDIRVVLIKLADRLHNMQSLAAVPEHKQLRIAAETMDIYAPLAERLGMGEIKGVLQDLSFPYVDPDGYKWIKQASGPMYRNTEKYLRRVMTFVEGELAREGIAATVHGRSKHLFSLHKKIQAKGRDFSDVYDLVAVRILVDNVSECYEVLGMLHQHWKPLLGRIKDYIALPKPNGYQSLHTTVFCIDGKVVEFQIRTHQMHREAEYGIAAHWSYSAYKGGGTSAKGSRLAWVQQLANWQQEISSSQEFMEGLKIDTFRHRIFVFTPNGEVKDLPIGAKPLDFAYMVHSKVGDACAGAKVNGKLVTLSTTLNNGDVVEILTSPKASPKPGWLDMAITSGAKSHIRKYLREHEEKGEDLEKPDEKHDGKPAPMPVNLKVRPAAAAEGGVVVAGDKGFLVRLAKCCKPAVGDSIMGIVTVGQGISVHKRWCSNIQHVADKGRLIHVSWDDDSKQRASLRLESYDKPGLTREVANIMARRRVNIVAISGSTSDDGINIMTLEVDMPNQVNVNDVVNDLLRHKSIYSVGRQ